MPFYEYKCNKCDDEFEELLSINDPDPKKCPKCGKGKPERLISKSTSFRLKGHGWTGVRRETLMKRRR